MPIDAVRNRLKTVSEQRFSRSAEWTGEGTRFYLLVALHVVALLYLSVFGIKAWQESLVLVAVADGLGIVFVSANLILLRNPKFRRVASRLFLALVGLLFLFLLVTGGSEGSGHLWLYSYSIATMVLLKKREGSLFTLLFLALVVVFLALPVQWDFQYTYSLNYKLRLLGSVFLVYILSLTYEIALAQASRDIARRNRRYYTLYNKVPVGLYSASSTGKLISANQALAEIFGCEDSTQLIREGLLTPGMLSDTVSKRLRDGVRVEGITRKLHRIDGSEIFIREKIRSTDLDADGEEETAAFEGSVEDITDLKVIEARKELYKNDLLVLASSHIRFGSAGTFEDVFRLLVEQAAAIIPEAITVVSEFDYKTGHLKIADFYAHPSFASKLTKTISDLRGFCTLTNGSFLEELIRGEIAECPAEIIKPVLESLPLGMGSSVQLELDHLKVSVSGIVFREELFGSAAFILGAGQALPTEKRNVLETLCSHAASILKRIASESELRRQHAFTAALLDTIPIPVFFKDREGLYLGCNNAMERFTGIKRDSLVGKSVHGTAPAEIAREYERRDRELFESGNTQSYEWKVCNAGGSLRDVRFYKACVRNESGKVTGLVGAFVDITEEKELLRATEAARDEAEKATQIKCNLLSAVSHEMRTPLTTILSLAESQLSRNDVNNEEPRLMCDASARLLGIVDSIITMNALDSGGMKRENQVFSVRILLKTICRQFSGPAGDKGLDFTCDLCKDLPTFVEGDKSKIEMVLRHIVSNAVKFTYAGTVRLTAKSEPTGSDADTLNLVFGVEDTGYGMDSDAIGHIYDPFWQADQSATRGHGGLGLGLPIAHSLMNLMDGTIGFSSAPNEGTVVSIKIPVRVSYVRTEMESKEAR